MNNFFRNNYFKLFTALFLLASAYFVNKIHFFEKSEDSKINDFIKILREKEKKVSDEISALTEKSSKENYENIFASDYYRSLSEKNGLFFYIYESDSLVFWSDNFIPLDFTVDTTDLTGRLLRLKNGWYEIFQKKEQQKTFVGLILLKTFYPIENKFLENKFHSDFSLSADAEIFFPDSTGIKIKSLERKDLLCIKTSGNRTVSSNLPVAILNILGFLFLIVFLKIEIRKFSKNIGDNKTVFLFILSLIGLRIIALLLQYPQSFYEMPLFSPEHYATSFLFPSLGDFIINILLLFYIAYFLRIHISLDFLNKWKRIQKRRLLFFFILALFSFSVLCEYLIKGLIEDSSISFNVNNLFELTGFSYSAIAAVGMLMFTVFFVYDIVVHIFHSDNFSLRDILLGFAIVSVPVLFFLLWFGYGFFPYVWTLIVFSVIFFIYKKRNAEYGFANIIILITVFSLLCTNILLKNISQKDITHRKLLSEKLIVDEDPVAEILYSEIEPRLLNDIIFSNLKYGLLNYDKEFFDNSLEQKYFSGYLSRYKVKSYLFRADGGPVSAFNKYKYDRNYFERLISQSGDATMNENMIHIVNPEENENYIIKLLVKDRAGKEITGVLYIAMESQSHLEETGFPELLLDKKTKTQHADKKYSFAKYRKGKLAEHHGKYHYSISVENYGTSDKKTSFDDSDGYNHLIYRTDKNTAVILSKQNEGLLESVTTFSYLFAIFGILVLFFLNLREFPKNLKLKSSGFNYKIQVMVVAVMLISLFLFGIGTSYYINIQYEEKNHKILTEKIHSVLIEVENKLSEQEKLDNNLKEYVSYILTKFSNVFFTDINLYNMSGTLYATSRPKLFNEGIISKKMNNNAFMQMKFSEKSEFIQDEKIGNLNYHSAYMPFKNKNGETLAYLNLPYFARQDSLEEEISSFLVTLINIYVFLFALSLMGALFISSAITRPLQYVQTMLSRVELGKTNKPIEYKGRDEIGRLVKVYNRKVAELEKSAELLAKSERETAWREMAKQVAHEIKNPLTPMKLSVQHLQRALKQPDANWEETLKKFSQTLIEQIDALTAIANEFSNFAKMPKANNETINLVSVIETSLHLFKETVKIVWKKETDEALIYADREQMQRVFINLIQNAIQAIPDDREGIIKINLKKDSGKITVRIEDNGTGINPELMDKIFSPNFTTKTAGMGLGLAMVKSIIEGASGKIWFETQIGKGTVFYVSLDESPQYCGY